MEEPVRRLSGGTERISMFTFMPSGRGITHAEMRDKEGYSDGTVGAVQTFLFRGEDGPWTSESLSALTGVDVVIRLSTALGQLGIYPTVDPLTSRSRLLTWGAETGRLPTWGAETGPPNPPTLGGAPAKPGRPSIPGAPRFPLSTQCGRGIVE
jgi:hypothetical protein